MMSWIVAEDAPNFGIVQAMIALLLVTFLVAVLAFRPSRRAAKRDVTRKPR